MKKLMIVIIFLSLIQTPLFADDKAYKLVKSSFDHIRGKTSEAEMKMVIHRPDFERTMVMKGWTKGENFGLFYTIAPAKDKGNATLKKGEKMWTFNPKINRVIKLPPSMMSQGWMGSDFSNNDLSKTDSIINDYNHEITGQKENNGIIIYDIKSVPKPGAPVVWGMQKLKIRSDNIMLEQKFFDQDKIAVKTLKTTDIQKMGDRLFPKVWIMKKEEEKDKYTKVEYMNLEFDKKLKPNLFSITSLKNLRK